MNTTNKLLDMLAAKNDIGPERTYRLHKILAVSIGSITNYREDKTQMTDKVAVRVATMLDLSPAVVLALVHADRAAKTSPETAELWRGMAQILCEKEPGTGTNWLLCKIMASAVYSPQLTFPLELPARSNRRTHYAPLSRHRFRVLPGLPQHHALPLH